MKMDFNNVWEVVMAWIHLAQDQWWPLVNTVMNRWIT
jgi:hypothetical protein